MLRKILLYLLSRLPEKSEALVPVRPANNYGTWLRVVQGPNRGGYVVRCCGTDTEFAASEAHRIEPRTCGCCKGPLNLLRSVDAITQDGNVKQDLKGGFIRIESSPASGIRTSYSSPEVLRALRGLTNSPS